ncbi:MAG: hypothetical protein JSS86_22005, partial [Cyanobacteria bacterium SZAS LIN-2]|nr:hypothetical protein [Cyanobacteria bacterium SZAS LIN-2]
SAVDQDVFIGNSFGGGKIVGPGSSFNVSGANKIIVNAVGSSLYSVNSIIFNGSQNLNTGAAGETDLNANTGTYQAVSVVGGTAGNQHIVVGNNKVVVSSQFLNVDANNLLIGNPLVFNTGTGFGTITDTTGSLDLSLLGPTLIVQGRDLAIIAAGTVTASAAFSIDLSGNSLINGGNGGNLSIFAGVTPVPGSGQNPNNLKPIGGVFTTLIPSGQNGQITLGNVSINSGTNVSNANGGNVLAVALDSTGTAGGPVTLGAINTSGTGATNSSGGNVTIIGNGISVGNITTLSTTNSGNVTLTGANPVLNSIVSTNGTITGTIASGANVGGAINLNGFVSLGNGNLSAVTGAGGNITTTGAISAVGAGTVALTTTDGGSITVGAGGISTATPITLSTVGGVGTGAINVNGVIATTGEAAVNLFASGAITEGGAGAVNTTGTLTTTSVGGTTLNGANTVAFFNATNTTSGNIVLTNTAAPLTVTGISQTGGGNVIVGNTGDLSVTGTISANLGGNVTLTSSGILSESGSGLVNTTGTLTTSSSGGTTLNG